MISNLVSSTIFLLILIILFCLNTHYKILGRPCWWPPLWCMPTKAHLSRLVHQRQNATHPPSQSTSPTWVGQGYTGAMAHLSTVPVSKLGHVYLPSFFPYAMFSLHRVSLEILSPIHQFTNDNNCSIEFDPLGFAVNDLPAQREILRAVVRSKNKFWQKHDPIWDSCLSSIFVCLRNRCAIGLISLKTTFDRECVSDEAVRCYSLPTCDKKVNDMWKWHKGREPSEELHSETMNWWTCMES
jgi:hypothetical protein